MLRGTKIIVFYPDKGVSEIQKRQMSNSRRRQYVYVTCIEGNFDDAQSGVKEIFNDRESFKELLEENNSIFSSANSINIGRLVPQIVYYFYAILRFVKREEIENR